LRDPFCSWRQLNLAPWCRCGSARYQPRDDQVAGDEVRLLERSG